MLDAADVTLSGSYGARNLPAIMAADGFQKPKMDPQKSGFQDLTCHTCQSASEAQVWNGDTADGACPHYSA